MSEKTRRIGIGYCRVSTEGQEENTSLEDQERKIRAFAESQGIEIVGIFSDVASGGNTRRQGYQAALKALKKSGVNCFLVAKFDRAHRHQLNMLQFEKDLTAKGIAFLSVAELLDSSTPTGRLMFQILSSFSEFEKNVINERTKGGRKAKIAKKQDTGGRVPVGYNPDWTTNQDSTIVNKIFTLYLSEGSLGRVQEKISSERLFSRQALHVILTNRAYLGEYRYDGEKEKNGLVIVGHHQPLVSQNVFGRVAKRLAARNKHRENE